MAAPQNGQALLSGSMTISSLQQRLPNGSKKILEVIPAHGFSSTKPGSAINALAGLVLKC
jgi:hypothetical protein